MMRLICLLVFSLFATGAAAKDIVNVLQAGTWGIDLWEDMSCARNPHKIIADTAQNKLIFKWPSPVSTADGSRIHTVYYTIQKVRKNRIWLMNDGTGHVNILKLANDGASYSWGEPNQLDADYLKGFKLCSR